MKCYSCNDTFKAYYDFIGFAEATGLKAPLVGPAYNDFRDYTIDRMHEQKSYGFDGIITECFEAWARDQTKYPID